MLKPVALLNPRPSPSRDHALPDWILASKLDPPPLRAGAVPRHGLLAGLEQAATLPLTLLLAPPGFGKTTLMAQWHRHLHETGAGVAWLSLDEDDAELGRFLGHLALALQAAGADPALCATLQPPHLGEPVPAQAVNTLIRAVRAAPRDITVLLDDYDRAACGALDDTLLRLAEHAGPRLHLLLATRRAPALPLARLALQGQLARFGSEQLALDVDEAQALLGTDVPAEIVAELCRYTEGWPVALHLARLWLDGNASRASEMARFSGRSVQIAAYLAEQVVADLDDAARDLLLHTAVLDRFNPTLADHVRHADDSGQVLARLGHFHGLLVPLDGDHEWFRQHPLFADYLQQQLERSRPGEPQRIHQRAARWFGEHGHLLDAVRHAARAGAGDLAAGYIARAGTWQLLLDHGTPQVRALLRHFDHRTIRETPALNLTQAYLHMKLGEFAHARLLLERFRDFPAALREPFQRDYTVVVALLRDLLDEICGNPHGVAQLAAQAHALDQDDHLGRGTLLCLCATTALGRAEFDTAERHARAAHEAMCRSGSEVGAGYALLHLGQSLFYRGRLGDAEQTYLQAQALALRNEQLDPALHAASCCLLAQLQYERGRHDQAADLLDPHLAFLEQHDGWLDVFASAYETALGLARLRDRSGRSALALLDHIDQLAQARRLTRLSELAVAWRLGLLLELPGGAATDALVARSGGEPGFLHALQRAHGWRQRAALGFALARWHRLAGRSSTALALLLQLEQACLLADNQHHLARTRARIAVVLQQRGEDDAALPCLHAALDHIARTQGWQVIAELGLPAKAMLRSLRQHDPQIIAGTTRALTVQALLDRLSEDEDAASDAFSEREIEVLAQLAHGYSNKQIGRRLHLSENTVKFHLKNLYRKLGARTREAALASALQRGLLRAHGQEPAASPPGADVE
jgi:LuxR family transcriptional regulator, maltose regulon positive regulatory protein